MPRLLFFEAKNRGNIKYTPYVSTLTCYCYMLRYTVSCNDKTTTFRLNRRLMTEGQESTERCRGVPQEGAINQKLTSNSFLHSIPLFSLPLENPRMDNKGHYTSVVFPRAITIKAQKNRQGRRFHVDKRGILCFIGDMKDERTEEQKYQAWVKTVNATAERGWRHVSGWVFKTPKGKMYDLSATDLAKLELLESK